jgi:hypothetical protein
MLFANLRFLTPLLLATLLICCRLLILFQG